MDDLPLLIDVAQATEMFLEAMSVIAPDGTLPEDFEEQMRAAARRAIERGDLDEAGVTDQGMARIRNMFGIRRH